ncbi:hypothetical protein CR513_39495, partial [Mucuna pruriens]
MVHGLPLLLHVHIPNAKRTKVEDKSVRCVLLGTDANINEEEERVGNDSVQNGAQHDTTHNFANEKGRVRRSPGWMENYISGK